MGALIQAQNWGATPLGPSDLWPQSLRTVVDLMLASPQPVYMAWGPALTALYNDAYVAILGGKHPDALGRPHTKVWPEIMDEYGPAIEAVMAGYAQRFEDRPVVNTNRVGNAIG